MSIGSPGYGGSPPCGPNTYAPEGEALADIVAKFAEDHDAWTESFFDAWEKIQLNGYSVEDLTEAPENGNLLDGVFSPSLETEDPTPTPLYLPYIYMPSVCQDARPAWCKKKAKRCAKGFWSMKNNCMATCGLCTPGEPGMG